MRKLVSRFALSLLAVGLLVGSAGTASAVSVNLYHSPLDNGAMAADPFNVTAGMTLNLWAIPSIDVYALNPLNLVATGTLGLGTCTAATNALCGGLIPGGRIVAWGDAINGSAAGVPIKLASIVITPAL